MATRKSKQPTQPEPSTDEDYGLIPKIEVAHGRILPDGTWMPNLGCPEDPTHKFNRQIEIYNAYERIILVSGSRYAGKTEGVLHRVCRHLFETPGGRIAAFAKTKGMARDCGSWQALIERAVPEWVAGNIGFEVTTLTRDGSPGTKLDPLTKSAYFRVRNYYGGESECRLFSIDNDNEIPAKTKNKEFSMVWFMELSTFKDPAILAFTVPTLRLRHLRPKPGEPNVYNMWIGDTNPDEDEGSDSWIYQEFYVKRQDYLSGKIKAKDETMESMYKDMRVIEMFHEDNPFITPQERGALYDLSSLKPGLMDSHWYGRWGTGTKAKSKHFADVFVRNLHVVGDENPGQDQIYANTLSTMLYCGWDIGKVNHGAVILDKWYAKIGGNEVMCWSVLAEKLLLDEKVKLDEFTKDFMQLMEAVQVKNGRKFQWKHWSDDTANTIWNPSSGTFDAEEISEASGGLITLDSAFKGDKSVRTRVDLLRKLIIQKRIYVSACCTAVIKMIENCKKGSVVTEYVARDDTHKHIFDALTYPIYMESSEELELGKDNKPTATPSPSRLVSV